MGYETHLNNEAGEAHQPDWCIHPAGLIASQPILTWHKIRRYLYFINFITTSIKNIQFKHPIRMIHIDGIYEKVISNHIQSMG